MKIGVVGYGSIGSRHAQNIETLGHIPVVYDPALRRDVLFERNIYEDCDAVVVASPTMFHEQAVRGCVERGKHLLIEKPIASTVCALQALLKTADEKQLIVMMGNNLRFHPCVQQTKHWIADGSIGDPIWAHFTCALQNDKPTPDGVLLNVGSHEVDLARYFFGPAICISANVEGNMADFVLRHVNGGIRSSFHLDLVTPNRIREFWIAGDKANIGVDLDHRRMSLGDQAKQAPGSYDDDYINEMRGFVDRINGVFAPGATGHEGLETLNTLLAVERKARR